MTLVLDQSKQLLVQMQRKRTLSASYQFANCAAKVPKEPRVPDAATRTNVRSGGALNWVSQCRSILILVQLAVCCSADSLKRWKLACKRHSEMSPVAQSRNVTTGADGSAA